MPSKTSSKFWVFTLNNPTELLDFSETTAVKYAVYQEEVGDAGTPHYQGYVELASTRQLSFMKKLIPGAHFQMRAGTAQQARDYCMKQDTRVSGPYEHGVWVEPAQGKRTDLLALKGALMTPGANLRKVAEDHFPTWVKYYRGVDKFIDLGRSTERPASIEVEFHLGSTGLGKTHYAVTQNPGAYLKPAGEWFDGYEAQDVIILDEFKGWLPFHQLLRLLDKYPMQIPVKGGFRPLVARKVVITSNYLPTDWYSNQRLHWDALWRRMTMFYHWTGYKCFYQTPNKDKFLDSVHGLVDTSAPPDTPPPPSPDPDNNNLVPPDSSPFTDDNGLMDLDEALDRDLVTGINPADTVNLTYPRISGLLSTEEFWDEEL